MRYILLLLALVAGAFGQSPNMDGVVDDIIIPLEGGSIVIRTAQFIRLDGYGSNRPEFNFKIRNQTAHPWRTLKVQFDIGGLCNGEPRQWALPVVTSLGWAEDHPVIKEYTDTVISLIGKVDGCKTELINASLVFAENMKTHIDGVTERVDFTKQLQELKGKRDAEAAAKAEEERKTAEAQAKKDAVEAEQRKRMAAEQKKKRAELDARIAKSIAEENARAAEERQRVRSACGLIYENTADKRVGNLTVREEQRVRACQALGMYPPQ